jgi:hypothetical protein
MIDRPHIKAALMLFDMVETLEPRLAPLKRWFLKDLVPTIDKWAESEGDQGIKRAKDALGKGWLLVLGEDPGDPMAFTKATPEGVPSLVQPLVDRISHLRKDQRLLSAVLSLTRVTDLWLAHGDQASVMKQIKTIRDSSLPGTAKAVIKDFSEFCHRFLSSKEGTPFGKMYLNDLGFPKSQMHAKVAVGEFYSEKSGPNGPLTESAHLDWCSLRSAYTSKGTSLTEEITALENEICHFVGPVSLTGTTVWEGLDVSEVSCGKAFSKYPGKISQIEEKSGKVRLVASPDYYTQKAMRPIHRWLMDLLKTIPMDCTFDQRSSIPKIAQWQNEGRTVYSVDQSSCTDLFPMDCQMTILNERFGNNLATRVRTVMCDREWKVTLPSGKVTSVRWAVGQPMGIYGSWPLMAVTHHLLVQYCAWRSSGRKSLETFRHYVICGDDIVIGRKAVADSYLKVVKLLGMKVNLTKSHISGGKTLVDPVSEFAKITIWKGKPLHPIRPNMVLRSVKDWRYAVPLFIDLANAEGFAARRKFLVKLVNRYFPSKKKFLEPLLSDPTFWGGCGLRDSIPLRDKFTKLDVGQIHPWILYLSNKIRSALLLENRILSLPERVPSGRIIREHPLTLVAETMDWMTTNYGIPRFRPEELPSVREIAREISENGIERYSAFLSGSELPAPSPVPSWVDRGEKRLLEQRTLWEKSLKKPRFWEDPDPNTVVVEGGPTSGFNRSPSPDQQYDLVTRILTSRRFATR